MNRAVWQKTYDFKFGNIGGLHCIAAGMHWGPTDKVSLITNGGLTEKSLEKEFEGCINNLNERKELCEQLVKEKPSLFSVLKNVHK